MLHPWLPHAALLAIDKTPQSVSTFSPPPSQLLTIMVSASPLPLLPQDQNAEPAFVPIFGGRDLAPALAMFAFYWQQRLKAIGTVLLCCPVSAFVDTVVTSQWGIEGMAWQHAIGGGLLGYLSLGLIAT
jgi:hypothetical protein